MKEIPISRGMVAMVDDCDHEWLAQYNWHIHTSGNHFYAIRRVHEQGKRCRVLMHRQIMNPTDGLVVDHLDSNGLNNCRANLRVCPNTENTGRQLPRKNGTSRYKGVSSRGDGIWWSARIGHCGYYLNLGHFNNEIEAAEAYDIAASKLHGEHAILNVHHFDELKELHEA